MPRQTIVLKDFSGGWVSSPSKRNLRDNELYSAESVVVDKEGIIRLFGEFYASTELEAGDVENLDTIAQGYGLYSFRLDHSLGSGDKKFLALAYLTSEVGKVCRIIENDGTVWSTGSTTDIVLSALTTYSFYPHFFIADGGLRICDAELNDTTVSQKYFGYYETNIENYLGGSKRSIAKFVATDATPSQPSTSLATSNVAATGETTDTSTHLTCGILAAVDTTNMYACEISSYGIRWAVKIEESTNAAAVVTTDISPQTWASAGYAIFPPTGGLTLDPTVTNYELGTWTTGKYELGYSAIYESGQESLIRILDNGNTTYPRYNFAVSDPDQMLLLKVYHTWPPDDRVKGFSIYCRRATTGAYYGSYSQPSSEWTFIGDVDFRKGVRGYENEYASWQGGSPTNRGDNVTTAMGFYYANIVVKNPGVETYRSRTGTNAESTELAGRYKTAVVANRRLYAGNVRVGGKLYGDSIFKSPVNNFDVLTEDNRLDIDVSDGDEIVKLASYADRIIVFKNTRAYILNVSQEIEFIEEVLHDRGIANPSAVTDTEYGPVWVNNNGVYWYDGERVYDLLKDLETQKRRLHDPISESNTESIYITATTLIIAYDRQTKSVFILSENSGESITVYAFSFVTFTWSNGYSALDSGSDYTIFTNAVTGWDNNVQIAGIETDTPTTGTDLLYTFRRPPVGDTTSRVEIKTKDMDFDLPNIDKKLYRVFVTHKNATGMKVEYLVNGTSNVYSFSTTSGASTGVLISGTSIETQEYIPTFSESHNIKSVQLLLTHDGSTTINDDFEIHDISLIIRSKGHR